MYFLSGFKVNEKNTLTDLTLQIYANAAIAPTPTFVKMLPKKAFKYAGIINGANEYPNETTQNT